jgi:hypothetical protein
MEFKARRQKSIHQFLSDRITAIASRAAMAEAAPLLAAPTHAGGWISADVLVERAQAFPRSRRPELVDAVQALLRLAPDGRSEALTRAAGLRRRVRRPGLRTNYNYRGRVPNLADARPAL